MLLPVLLFSRVGRNRVNKIEAALAYVRAGWSVIPLCWPDRHGQCACPHKHTGAAVGKAPLVRLPEQVTESTVLDWWRRWPDANIGVLVSQSGLVVVDADSNEGVQEVEELLSGTKTLVSSSGRGRHYIFKNTTNITRRVIHVGECHEIDVLADGYVILPPSKHRTGQVYTWVTTDSVSDAPAWVTQWLSEKHSDKQVTLTLGEIPNVSLGDLQVSSFWKKLIVVGYEAAPGRYRSRSELCFAVIRVLLQAGHSPEQVAAVLLNEAWAVGDRLREKPDPLEAVRAEIERCIAKAPESVGDRTDIRDKVLGGKELAELLKQQDFEFLVEGLIPKGMLVILGGHAKSGKTTLSFHLAKAVLHGGVFLGHKATKAPVIYINNEMHTFTLTSMYSDIISRDPDNWPATVAAPSVPVGKMLLKHYIEQVGSKESGLIIIDSAAAAFGFVGDEENQSGQIASRVRPLLEFCHTTGWTVMLIHHTRKAMGGEKPTIQDLAGSREYGATADIIFVWQPGKDQGEPGWLLVTGRIPQTYYNVRLMRQLCERVEIKNETDTARERVINALIGNNGGLSRADIEEITELPMRTVQYVLKELIKEGAVHGVGDTKSKNRRYILREELTEYEQ